MKNNIYNVIKTVISSKRYELAEMLTKIDTLWVQGSITEEQRLSLILDAQNNAMVENSIDVLNKLYDLEKRVTALENKEEIDKPVDDETEEITYPPYEAGKWYQNGDIVSFDEKNYKCIAPIETVCVWSPTDYPAYWEMITKENTEE
jgi:hypothetical protein